MAHWLERDVREHEDKILLLLTLVVSAVVGLTIVAFVAVTERLGSALVEAGPWRRLLSPVVGSLVGGWLLWRVFPEARGSGIPQTRVALLLKDGYISLRTVVGKFVCSGISLGSGVALGREGPSVQMGAGIASVIGRRLGLSEAHVRTLVPVGTAAAVAAAFNTPLAAVLFTLEEILADLNARIVGPVVVGAATSWMILRLVLGDEPLFHVPGYELVHPLEFLIYAVLGLLGGVVSTVFVKALLWQRQFFLRMPVRFRAVTPAVGGLVVGLLALAVPGVLGVGYNLVGSALNGQLTLQVMLLLLVLKVVATSCCYGSGNAGGIFGPSLFIGAMLGGVVGTFTHSLLPDQTANGGAYALVGMGAAFAGIVGTPMTSVIMIFELTRDYSIIVPLMIANLCSYALARRLQRVSVYEALSHQEGIVMPSAEHRPEPVTVARAMRPLGEPAGIVCWEAAVHPDDPVDVALQKMGRAGVEELVVVSREGSRPVGVVGKEEIWRAYREVPAPNQDLQSGTLRRWLPVLTVVVLAGAVILSGLTVWQRTRRTALGQVDYEHGRQMLAQGRAVEAVLALRSALARAPRNNGVRVQLGLALVETGHYGEAELYLEQARRTDPANALVLAGLAAAAEGRGAREQAADLYRRALGQRWPADEERRRVRSQLARGRLLADTGKQGEGVELLLTVIDQSGSDVGVGREAAEWVAKYGSSRQALQGYEALAVRFPADGAVRQRLAEVRAVASREREVARLDPMGQRLTVRERARRWDAVLRRMEAASEGCAAEWVERLRAVAKRRSKSLEGLDEKADAARVLWGERGEGCARDPVIEEIFSRLKE
jgi:CIC family chloride channel protein